MKHLICLLVLLYFSPTLYAQVVGGGLTQDSTLLEEDIYFADSNKKNERGFFSMFEGNPGRAALYSAVLPGAGQIYNKKWIKAPIVWGLEGTAIALISYYGGLHNTFDLAYKGLKRGEITEALGYTDADALGEVRDRLKQYRDYSIIGLAAAHVLNIADAFVDRHLLEFDVDEDISLRFGPAEHGIGLTMAFD